MFPVHIALVSQTPRVTIGDLAVINAALSKQVARDFVPIWNIQATIDVFQHLENVPAGYWPIIVVDGINTGDAGIHLDGNRQPFALVAADDDVPLICSHELLEMLVDPFGDRFVTSDSLLPDQGRVAFLVEVCDPCQDKQFGYPVNGLILADFYTPSFFDPVAAPGVRYSFKGAIRRPKQILKNGYITWRTFDTQEWFQANLFGNQIAFDNLGQFEKDGRSWREIIDSLTTRAHELRMAESASLADAASSIASLLPNQAVRNASMGWATSLNAQIDTLRYKNRL